MDKRINTSKNMGMEQTPIPRIPDYPAIASMAAIGDGRSVALVGPDGNLEWFCPQRFDAPPLIWPLLDRQRGGRLQLAPLGADVRMRYLDNTAALEFEVHSASGRARVTLCMEWPRTASRTELSTSMVDR